MDVFAHHRCASLFLIADTEPRFTAVSLQRLGVRDTQVGFQPGQDVAAQPAVELGAFRHFVSDFRVGQPRIAAVEHDFKSPQQREPCAGKWKPLDGRYGCVNTIHLPGEWML